MWTDEVSYNHGTDIMSKTVASEELKRAKVLVDYVGIILGRVFPEQDQEEFLAEIYAPFKNRFQTNNAGEIIIDRASFEVVIEILNTKLPALRANMLYQGVDEVTFEAFARAVAAIKDTADPEKIPECFALATGESITATPKALHDLVLLSPKQSRQTSLKPVR